MQESAFQSHLCFLKGNISQPRPKMRTPSLVGKISSFVIGSPFRIASPHFEYGLERIVPFCCGVETKFEMFRQAVFRDQHLYSQY